MGFGGNGKMIAEKLLAFKMNVSVVNDTRKKIPKKINFFLKKNIKSIKKRRDYNFNNLQNLQKA